MRAEQGEAYLDPLTITALTRSICFRQVLGPVRRSSRLDAVLNKIVRNPGPFQIQGGRLFLRFRERDVSDHSVGVDLVDNIVRHPEIGRFRWLGQTLSRSVFWEKNRAWWLSALHREAREHQPCLSITPA